MQKLISFFLLVSLVSCAEQDPVPVSESFKQTDTIQPFKKEIPTLFGKVDMWYDIKNQKEQLLKLDSLESGFDSLQIRIWYEYALVLYRDLIIIKCTNNVWIARHYHMKLKWDPNDNPETYTSIKKEDASPKSGWPGFIKSFRSFV
jgi:hypothetical protein